MALLDGELVHTSDLKPIKINGAEFLLQASEVQILDGLPIQTEEARHVPDRGHTTQLCHRLAQATRHPLESVEAVVSTDEVVALQGRVREVTVERSLGQYIIELAEATRRHPSVALGCSPRGTLMLFRAAQARALLEGRAFVVPEDVKAEAVPVLAHRLGLETKARYTGVEKEDVVREILDATPVPD